MYVRWPKNYLSIDGTYTAEIVCKVSRMRHAPKVLHIVESLNKGAVENWLLRMGAHAIESGVDLNWTFYCILDVPGQMEETARALGFNIVRSPIPMKNGIAFIVHLRQHILGSGYDVIHCHHDVMNGMYLVSSIGGGEIRKICHIHNADEVVPVSGRLRAWVLRHILKGLSLLLADKIVGVSDHTLDKFIYGRCRRRDRDVVHYYGVDEGEFVRCQMDRAKLRRMFDLDECASVLLFGGRLVPEKNPLFVLDVLEELKKLDPNAVCIFAGSGSVEGEIVQVAAARGLASCVRMVGWRRDLPWIMCNCDWFILPRPEVPMEGFGLAVVEAQLAGLRLLLSNGIADDPLLPSGVFRRLALSEGPASWARHAFEMSAISPAPEEAIRDLHNSAMHLDKALVELLALHSLEG